MNVPVRKHIFYSTKAGVSSCETTTVPARNNMILKNRY
jgi:hypothetical protein